MVIQWVRTCRGLGQGRLVSGHVEGPSIPRPDMARARGTCRICGYQGMLDPHHIISHARARRLGRLDLISNPFEVARFYFIR